MLFSCGHTQSSRGIMMGKVIETRGLHHSSSPTHSLLSLILSFSCTLLSFLWFSLFCIPFVSPPPPTFSLSLSSPLSLCFACLLTFILFLFFNRFVYFLCSSFAALCLALWSQSDCSDSTWHLPGNCVKPVLPRGRRCVDSLAAARNDYRYPH